MTLQYSNKSLIRALSLDLNLADILMALKPDFNRTGYKGVDYLQGSEGTALFDPHIGRMNSVLKSGQWIH